jgi:trehalose 6-phosphate synthase/phosphatase
MPGGLSSALSQGWNNQASLQDEWWHMSASTLNVIQGNQEPKEAATLPEEVVGGHYRFCNEFLWPVMHNCTAYAVYREQDYRLYEKFNSLVGWYCSSSKQVPAQNYFVHDYQLATLPRFLRSNRAGRIVVFWHIPWPKEIADETARLVVSEIARGLLQSDGIGFHTREYAENFMRFIETALPELHCDFEAMEISGRQDGGKHSRIVRIIVAPLGLDFEHWSARARTQGASVWHAFAQKVPFVLSVDRADYTKGVINRLEAISHFFHKFPEWRQQIAFAQVCPRSRTGISAFDDYYAECKQRASVVQEEWSTSGWQPIIWQDQPLSGDELALLYRNAALMLVNPIQDGLNLTAKEYVACQGGSPGTLALSPAAGVWHELGEHAILVDPKRPEQMAEGIKRALTLGESEKILRMKLLQQQLQENSLSTWWQRFAELVDGATVIQTPNRCEGNLCALSDWRPRRKAA